MRVYELSRDQIISLKQSMLCSMYEDVSFDDLAKADNIIKDEEVFNEYDGVVFTEDDF